MGRGIKSQAENTKKAAAKAKASLPLHLIFTPQSHLARANLSIPQKAEATAEKTKVEEKKLAEQEDQKWSEGAKNKNKAAEAANKKAETARKKAEKDALLAEEEKDQPSKPKGAGAKTAQKKTRGLDLSALDSDSTTPSTALNATGIDNALDALSLTSNTTSQLDRHPERRYKAALAAYEAKRLPELDEEMKGLRRNQKIELIRKEFEKSEDNPFNKTNVRFDATREEIDAVRRGEREKVEGRLAER